MLNLEEEYFHKENAEKRRALRLKLARQAHALKEKREVAKAAGTADLDLAEHIEHLGFDHDSAKAFDLLPLVHVAWADGKVSRNERATVLQLLEKRGFGRDSSAFLLFESLLEEKPDDAFFSESEGLLKRLLADRPERTENILELCVQVAEASGGFWGLTSAIADEERDLITQIGNRFGDDSSKALTTRIFD